MNQINKRYFILLLIVFIAVNLLSSCKTNTDFYQHNIANLKNIERIHNIIAYMPNYIQCEHYDGSAACRYSYTIIFTETEGILTTIDSIKKVYIDTKGGQWATYGQAQPMNLKIKGGESKKESGSVTTDPEYRDVQGKPHHDLRGGIVVVIFTGNNEKGQTFTGRVSSKLAMPQ
jgi:hypothetical protein